MAGPGPARAPASAELTAFVQEGVDEVRRTNALGLAWLRLGLRTLTLMLYLRYVLGPPDKQSPFQLPAVYVNVAHLAVGAVVLVLLVRRRGVERAILAGAISDFAVVSIAAWRAAGSAEPAAGLMFMMGAYELVLLFAAFTLGTRMVAALSVFSVGFLASQLARLPTWDSESWLILLILAAFGAAATFAGTRVVGLASRTAAEEFGAGLLRLHAEELAASNAALLEARSRTELLTRLVVHDLRSPLTSVLAGLDMALEAEVRRAPGDPEAEESLAIARAEAWRLVGMISDLVAVGKLEQGVRAERVSTDVGALLQEVALAYAPQARSAGVSVRVSAPSPLRARLDHALVRRSVENLVSNALRHVGHGDRIELSATASGDSLRIAARNSGPPVPAELRGRIFEKDVSGARGDWSRAGLGLHFCALAAEALGGRIALVERAGWNVSFEIELPGAAPGASAEG